MEEGKGDGLQKDSIYVLERFSGDLFNRINRRCRKILPTLEERIIDMFDFAG